MLMMLGSALAPALRSLASTLGQTRAVLSSAASAASDLAPLFPMTTEDSALSTSLSTEALRSPLTSNVLGPNIVLSSVADLYSKMRHFMPY